jgi:hypothetical protein
MAQAVEMWAKVKTITPIKARSRIPPRQPYLFSAAGRWLAVECDTSHGTYSSQPADRFDRKR